MTLHSHTLTSGAELRVAKRTGARWRKQSVGSQPQNPKSGPLDLSSLSASASAANSDSASSTPAKPVKYRMSSKRAAQLEAQRLDALEDARRQA